MWLKPDPKSPRPMSAQIRADILVAIASRRYRPGDKLPSVRGLASEILVNPNTVAKVYRDLERDGLLETRRGSGMLVAPLAHDKCMAELRLDLEESTRSLVAQAHRCGLDGDEIHGLIERMLLEGGVPEFVRKDP